MNIQPNKSTVLVTGATGFAGAYVVRDLVNAGYYVKALRRTKKIPDFIDSSIWDKVTWEDGDILDIVALEEAMENVDAVIHCAGKVSFHKKDKKLLYKVNTEGTANIVNVAIEKNIKRLIHVSSVAAIGRKPGGEITTEKTKWTNNKLQTAYGMSKYNGEMEVWRGIGEGLNAVIVNPSTILGYGDWNTSSATIFRNVYQGFPWYTNGTNGFVDVEDVSRAIISLLNNPVSGERFILNGDNWSFRKLLNTIADEFSKKRPTRHASPMMSAIAWRMASLGSLFTGKESILSKETAKIAQSISHFDNNKILNTLPDFAFTPLAITIREACKKYINH